MEIFLVPFIVLVLIIVILVVPGAAARQATIEHERTLTAMQDVSDEAKARMTDLHRAYRAELSQAARAHGAHQRRMR
jgi:hypothetical protein